MSEDAGIESMDDRLTQEVTLLSTKLVNSVAKQLELEEKLLHLHKDNGQLKQQLRSIREIESKYNEIIPKYEEMQKQHVVLKEAKESAEAQNTKLQGEVEDLTASLFSEANEMVSNASREAYNFKVKNRKLYEEIDEKNTIIDNLQDQLKDLKLLFFKIEDQQKLTFTGNGTPKLEQSSNLDINQNTGADDEPEDDSTKYNQQLESIIYSPAVRAIRFDLVQYQNDFKAFIYTIIKPEFHLDLNNLKTLKFFRTIWTEEIETSIPIIPSLVNSSFINRWQRGKNFWNLIVEGKAVIEPISGVNETFKLAYKGDKLNKDAPVAIKDPCSFCGQCKNDILEHSRLYSLKLLNPDSSSTSETPEVIVSYPLCNYCLIKLRTICDFFAKLRLISNNVYKLKQSNRYDELVTSSFQFSRSFNNSNDSDIANTSTEKSTTNPEESEIEECKVMKLYFMLNLIRNKIFWNKIGFWDNAKNIHEVNIDDLSYDAFKTLIVNLPKEIIGNNEISRPAKSQTDTTSTSLKETDSAPVRDVSDANDISESMDIDNEQLKDASEKENEEFADTSETFHDSESDNPMQLSRKNSKSKQFKKKMDNDLNETLNMLEESINDE